MGMQTRLDTVSRNLADSFRKAVVEKQREAVRLSCEMSCEGTGLDSDTVREALRTITSGGVPHENLRKQVAQMAEDYDEEFFRLSDETGSDSPGAVGNFLKARAASALKSALEDDPAEQHEAIYEAVMSLDENPSMIEKIQAVLSEPAQRSS